MAEGHLADGLFEEYLRLRAERESGRRPKPLTVYVSFCCHRPCYTDRATGWDLCVGCHKRTTFVELTTTQLRSRAFNRWRKIHVREGLKRRTNPQERWLVTFLDQWRRVEGLFHRKPRNQSRREWASALQAWELLLQSRFGSREAVALALGWTPGQVRYRVERAREIVTRRIAESM